MTALARTAWALVILILFVGTAHAECAWVLWSERTSADGAASAWKIQAGFPSPSQCREGAQKAAAGYADKVPRPVTSQTARGPSVLTGWRDAETTTTYVCLPDTIDPRGDKGK